MADLRKRLPHNVDGPYFVDSTCIDCDTCRQLAPASFKEHDEVAIVYRQPQTEIEQRQAARAMVCCPTGSIGTTGPNMAGDVMADFPLQLDGSVYYCGFNSPKSYGGNSYWIAHPDGNWMVDSPKYLPHLVRQFEARGGIARIFLTHQDDVAEAARYAETFGSQRIIHQSEEDAQPGAEILISGTDPVAMGADFTIIPTPGHTEGHMVLLYRDQYLFTGDHLSWDRENHRLRSSKSYCWYSWKEQIRSMERLLDYRFEWILPGHGQRVHLPADEMHQAMGDHVARMKKQ